MGEIVISEAEKERLKEICANFLDQVDWRNNTTFSADTSLSEALDLAKNGKDAGKIGAIAMEPKCLLFHEWMQYAHLITIYYNWNKSEQKYTILRNGCYSCIISHLYIAFCADY